MNSKRKGSLSRDWDKLTRQLSKPKPWPLPLPEALPLGAIRLWPAVFQHRRPRGYEGAAHVRKMAEAIGRGRMLDPLTVWWDGKAWACIDGHHRYDAYQSAGIGGDQPVPVVVFSGPLEVAMGLAASANSKDKLTMSSAEKSDAAWRMVAATNLSKAVIATAAGVSESTVANMRRARAILESRCSFTGDGLETTAMGDVRDLRWMEAKARAAGTKPADFDYEEHSERKAQEMALALRRALGKEGAKYPEILARALDIYDTRLMDQLVDWWTGSDQEPDEEAECEAA